MMEYLILLPNRKAKYYWIDFGLFVCGLIFLFASKWIPAILMLLMAVMGFLIRKKPYLHFTEKGVKVHMVWVKHYNWNELKQAMLKEGMLTLDFVNNRLFQEAVHDETSSAINEDAFNAFCEANIQAANATLLN